jgi:hypothetical protein
VASILDFNCLPNILHYWVKFINNGGDFNVYLYKSLSDAQAETNDIAYATSRNFGSSVEIILTNTGSSFTITKFDDTKNYHLLVNFQAGDATTIFQVGPFHDGEVQDELLTTTEMIKARCLLELNIGTHAKSEKSVDLSHSPSRYDGDIIRLNTSDFTNVDNKIGRVKVVWDGKLYDRVTMYSYEDLKFYEEV